MLEELERTAKSFLHRHNCSPPSEMASPPQVDGSPRLQGNGQPPATQTNDLQHVKRAESTERLLQEEFEKQKGMKDAQFLMAQSARKEAFDQAEAAERQEFQKVQARKKSEFEVGRTQREKCRSQQTSKNELIKLERQREDAEHEYEMSRLQEERDFKIAQRRREDSHRDVEAKHTMTHNEAMRKLRTDLQNSSTMKAAVSNLDIPTPPLDHSTIPENPTTPQSARLHPSRDGQLTHVPTPDRHPSNSDDSMQGDGDRESSGHEHRSTTEQDKSQIPVALTQPPQTESNPTQSPALTPDADSASDSRPRKRARRSLGQRNTTDINRTSVGI